MITIYGIKNCDSVKKAVKYMKAHNLSYHFIDFRETPVGAEKIASWLQKVSITKLFNTRGTTYRTHKLKELGLDDAGKEAWLAKENMLIKRPVIEYDNNVLVGYDEALYNAVFKG